MSISAKIHGCELWDIEEFTHERTKFESTGRTKKIKTAFTSKNPTGGEPTPRVLYIGRCAIHPHGAHQK